MRLSIAIVVLLALSLAAQNSHAESAASVAVKAQAAINSGNAPKWWTPELPEAIKNDVTKKGPRLAEQLKLGDEDKTQNTAALITEHFGRVWAWNEEVKPRLDAAWAAWDEARNNANGKEKDELKALAVATEQLDPIYAEFTPQIQGFIAALRKEIGEEKTMELVDIITRSPGAKRTYNAYVEMVPEMTDDEKAILWDRMAQAREDALAAWSDGQIIKIFKKYKVRNEFSLDYFGYGYQKRYKAWIEANK